jgi:hypothetical protein
MGPVRHVLLNAADRERTAYHEAGHALLALLVKGSDPVHRVSIVPRGMALGATYQAPVEDRTGYGEDTLRARITGALGGRAAEQLIYGVVTTGAESDLQQVTEIARRMVLRWGMSAKLGPISFVAAADDGLPPAFQRQPYSEATSELIDAEVRRIVEECHADADRLLAEHRPQLESLARSLLEHESLDAQAVRAAAGMGLAWHRAGRASGMLVPRVWSGSRDRRRVCCSCRHVARMRCRRARSRSPRRAAPVAPALDVAAPASTTGAAAPASGPAGPVVAEPPAPAQPLTRTTSWPFVAWGPGGGPSRTTTSPTARASRCGPSTTSTAGARSSSSGGR